MIYSIAIIDPVARQRNEMMTLVDRYLKDRGLAARLECFRSGNDLLRAVQLAGAFDVYIIEPKMPDMNGISLVRELRAGSNDGRIIYYSDDDAFAARAFDVKAAAYMIRPVSAEKLERVLDDVIITIKSVEIGDSIELKVKNGRVEVPVDDIGYVNIVNRALCFHMEDGLTVKTLTLRIPFKDAVADLLSDPDFVLAGSSLMINMAHIASIKDRSVRMDNGEFINPPRRTISGLKKSWSLYRERMWHGIKIRRR